MALGDARVRPPALRIARGARAVEALVLEDLRRCAEEARGDPARLRLPVRVVVPSRSLREHLSAALVRGAGCVAGVRVETLHGLALGVLERAGDGAAPDASLYPIRVRQLAREERALRERLEPLEDGYASVEAGVTDLLDAGFEPAHAEAIGELCEANGASPSSQRAAALVRVAARVAGEVEAGRLGHASRLLRRARELVEADPVRALPAREVLVHGFADATGVQTDLIEALLRHCGARVLLDEPPDPVSVEPDRAFGLRFRRRLEAVAGDAARDGPDPADAELCVLHAPGPTAEARAVAERLRAQLDAGVAPERLALVARELAPYRAPLRRHLGRLAVPFSGCGERGPTGPAGRRLGALLELLRERERTPAERWLDALGSLDRFGWRSPLAVGDRADLRLALHVLGAGRLGDVTGIEAEKREGPLPLPVRRGLEVGESGDPVAPRRRLQRPLLVAAVRAARAVRARLETWPASQDLEHHLEWLRRLVDEDLDWSPALPGRSELDERLFGRSRGGLALSGAELLVWLERELEPARRAPVGGEGGGVQLLNVLEARARVFEHVFCLGLNRDVFPRVVSEDPLLPDSLRARLRALLPDLPVKREGRDEERHLFAQLLCASPRVTLSCAVTDDDGKPRPISPLLEGLRMAGRAVAPQRVPAPLAAGSLGAAPRPAHEHAQLAGLFGSPQQFGAALRAALEEARRELGSAPDPDAIRALAEARIAALDELDPRERRPRGPGPYFGFVGTPRAGADPRRAPLYVTAAEHTAKCPWQSFLHRVLHLEPAPDVRGALPGLDRRLLGALVHDVLEHVVSAHTGPVETLEQALRGEPVEVPWPDDLDGLLHERARVRLQEEGIALPGLAAALAQQARAFLEAARALDWAGGPVRALGAELTGEVRVRDDEGLLQTLRFRVDRVDATARGLRLVDYKTGKPPSQASGADTRRKDQLGRVAQGHLLQASAYAGVPESAARGEAEGVYHFLRPDLDDSCRVFAVFADDAELSAAFASALGAIVRAREAGSFFPRLEDEKGEEPRLCLSCEVKSACLRGDSGARARLTDWVAVAAGRGALDPVERPLLELWRLGAKGTP